MKHIWWKSGLAIVIPAASIAPIIASCSNYSKIEVTESNLVIDTNKSSASLVATIKQQPLDDVALVSVINTSGDHLVSMFRDDEEPYSHENSLVLPVKDKQININLCFDDFVGENTTSTFNLEIDYKNKNNKTVTAVYNDLTLSTSYNRPEGIEKVHILDINDIHGAAPGYGDKDYPSTSPKNPGVIRLINNASKILNDYPGSIFLSAGDNNSGEAFSSSTHAESMFPILKAMGVQYSAVGNHAFEWGYDDLTTEKFDRLGRTDATLGNYLITSNILQHPYYQDHEWMFNPRDPGYNPEIAEADYSIWKNQFVTWADPYKLVSLNGHLVCLVGLTTTKALTDGNQSILKNTAIIDYAPAIYYATRYCYDTVGEDWYNSIDTFVMLTHVESKQDDESSGAYLIGKNAVIYDPLYETDTTYAEHTNVNNKLSLVISGHSHADVIDDITNDISNKPVKIGQANNAGRAFLDSAFSFDNTKPVGQRWVGQVEVKEIKDDIKPYWGPYIDPKSNPTDWTPAQKAQAMHYASLELNDMINNPKNELVKKVVDEYQHQSKDVVQPKLSTKIAETKTGHLYSPLHAEQELGHEYIMPFHVIESAGSWNCAASIAGFDFLHYEEIKSPSSVTFPAINFMSIDSITGEIPEDSDVTLNNMYNIQPHDNPTWFGYLSVWQLAAIINYSLSGGILDSGGHTYFDYQNHHSYETYPITSLQHRNLSSDYEAYNDGTNFVKLFNKTTPDTTKSCYVAGPMQWYGFKFTVDKVAENDQAEYGRKFTLQYVDKKSGDKYKNLEQKRFPNIQIYDPTMGEPFDTFYDVNKWVDVQDWLVDKETTNGLIPCIINDFMYTGGNDQNYMFQQYFEENHQMYGKAFEPVLFSTLTRDLNIEYCYETYSKKWPQLDFDGTYHITGKLINIPV